MEDRFGLNTTNNSYLRKGVESDVKKNHTELINTIPLWMSYMDCSSTEIGCEHVEQFKLEITHFRPANTGSFIMFSVTTNIYNKKTKGPTLMELFTSTGKLKKFF
jgi:hypothetical protein